MNKKQKIIFGVIFVLVTLGLAFALYYLFFAPTQPKRPPQPGDQAQQQFPQAQEGEISTTTIEEDQLPETVTDQPETDLDQPDVTQEEEQPTQQQQKVKQVVSDSVNNTSLDQEDNARFYNSNDGKFYEIDDNGNLRKLSDKTFFNVDKVAWAPNEDKAILEYPDGNNIYYNFETNQQETIPKHWEEFSFNPRGDKIAAKSMGFSPNNRWLVKTNPDGSSAEKLVNLGNNADEVEVDWSPNQEIVGFSKTGSAQGAYRQEVLLIGDDKQDYKSLNMPGRDLQTEWSPSGEKLLFSGYSARNNYKPELWVVNAAPGNIGKNRRRLNIDTWASKCTFQDDRYVFCGVPKSLRRGAGFQPSSADNIVDNIYKIDTRNGSKTKIPNEENITVEDIMYRNNKLLIKAKNKSGLFEIEL